MTGTSSAEFPLTDLQEAYLVGMSGLIELGGFRPNHYVELDVVGLDPARAEAALNKLIERHEHLRTIVLPEGRQRVLPAPGPIRLRVVDLAEDPGAREETLRAMRDEGVDPTRWPMFDVVLHRVRPRRFRVHIAMSLLLLDGRGIRQLIREWQQFYADPAAELAPAPVSFRSARMELLARESSDVYREHWQYWAGRIDDLPEAPALPLARQLDTIGQVRFTRRTCLLSPAEWQRLRASAGRNRVLPVTALIHLFAEVLGAWAENPRFCLNVLHQRWSEGGPEWAATVGQFGATLPLEVDLRGNAGFWERGQALQRQLWRDMEHADVSAVRVMREVAARRGWPPRAALPYVFTSMLSSGGTAPASTGPAADGARFACRMTQISLRTPQVLVDNQIQEAPDGGAECVWDTVDDAFPPGMVESMFDTYRRALRTLAGPGDPPGEPDLRPAGHRDIVTLDNRAAGPPPPGRLEDGFLRWSAVQPEAIALVSADRTMTYSELETASGMLARQLRAHGAGPGEVVPVVMAKGWEQIVAVLGVLRAGAAYCPVDASLPTARIKHLLAECRARVALIQPGGATDLDGVSVLTVRADTGADTGIGTGTGTGNLAPSRPGAATDLAYVIYTSGSTGQPKGVQIEHRSAVNTIAVVSARIGLTPGDRVFGISSLSFDLSVWDTFGTLAAGATLVLPAASARPDPAGWAQAATQNAVTVWNSVPALAEMLAETIDGNPSGGPPIRAFLLSGDWIGPALARRLRELWPGARIVAMGGATEASIWSNIYEVDAIDPAWRSVPYGKPLANQTMRVLDHRLDVRPPWAAGRIYIGGTGLASGYRNDPERTAERFIRHPLTGERLYWTGDLGRYWPDGTIEFLGREDRQLKIQGFRVEPGEVEATAREHPAVRDCLVCAQTAPGGSARLIALVVPREPARPEPAELLAHVRARLPRYLVPARLDIVPRLPLTANGKVDVSAALAMADSRSQPRSAGNGADAGDQVTARLAGIWGDLLGLDGVRPDDDFFALGGNSMLALRLVNRVRAEFEAELPFGQVFEARTVRAIAGLLGRDHERGGCAVTLASGTGPQLYLFHPVGGSITSYLPLARSWGGPVRAFQSAALAGLAAPPVEPDLTQMATGYLRELRHLAPTGPYLLGGWSMGGVLAYEVAGQLAELGEAAYPFLIDSYPGGGETPATSLARHLGFLSDLGNGRLPDTAEPALTEAALAGADPADLDRLALELAVTGGLLPPELEVAEYQRLVRVHASNLAALAGYQPRRRQGPALLLTADQGIRPNAADAWRNLCPDLSAQVLPGDHYSIMNRDGIGAVMRAVREWAGQAGFECVPNENTR